MALEIRPLHPLLGVELVGVDVNQVDADIFERIVGAFEDHSVLLSSAGRRSTTRRRSRSAAASGRSRRPSARSSLTLDIARKSPTSRTSTRTTG
jgi:hypothetical protein